MNTFRITMSTGKVFLVKRFGDLPSLSLDLDQGNTIQTEQGKVVLNIRHIAFIEIVE